MGCEEGENKSEDLTSQFRDSLRSSEVGLGLIREIENESREAN